MKTLLFIVIIAFNCVLSQYKYQPVILLERSLRALDRLLEYLIKNNDGLIEDTVFGVVISRSILKSILDNHQPIIRRESSPHLYKDLPLYMSIRKLKRKCEYVVDTYENNKNKPNIYRNYPMIKKMLDFDLWKMSESLKFDELIWKKPRENKDLFNMYLWMLQHHNTYVMSEYSTPHENQSDHCISELLRNGNSATCYASPNCWGIMTTGPRAFGYPLTHRLMYMQLSRQRIYPPINHKIKCSIMLTERKSEDPVIRAWVSCDYWLGCRNKPYFHKVKERVENLCAEILAEAEIIDILGFPIIFQDLFFEQVVFCGGIERYSEFLRLNWMDEILSLQREDGCYGNYTDDDDDDDDDNDNEEEAEKEEAEEEMENNISHRRQKRSDAIMDNNCLMHMTGVAAAALSTNIQALIDLDSTFLGQNKNSDYKKNLRIDKITNITK